jgi:hypothetical protein
MLSISLATPVPSPLSSPLSKPSSTVISIPAIAHSPSLVDKISFDNSILSNSEGGGGYSDNLQQFRDLIQTHQIQESFKGLFKYNHRSACQSCKPKSHTKNYT